MFDWSWCGRSAGSLIADREVAIVLLVCEALVGAAGLQLVTAFDGRLVGGFDGRRGMLRRATDDAEDGEASETEHERERTVHERLLFVNAGLRFGLRIRVLRVFPKERFDFHIDEQKEADQDRQCEESSSVAREERPTRPRVKQVFDFRNGDSRCQVPNHQQNVPPEVPGDSGPSSGCAHWFPRFCWSF